MSYQLQTFDVAGFDVIGYQQPNGMIKLGGGELVDEFPYEIEFCGAIYTLEEVKVNMVPEGHPTGDPTIRWALYV